MESTQTHTISATTFCGVACMAYLLSLGLSSWQFHPLKCLKSFTSQ